MHHTFTKIAFITFISLSISTLAFTQTTYIVNDDGGGDFTTITAAIAAASANDIIEITGGANNIHTEDAITVDKNLTIRGQGQTTTTLQAAATQASADDAIFIVNNGLTVAFQDILIQNGNALAGGSSSLTNGGAVYINCNASTDVSFTNVTLDNNRAEVSGGAVYATGDLGTINFTDCVISNNAANPSNSSSDGGGIANLGADFLNLIRCSIIGNQAGDAGGGFKSQETNAIYKIINCTIAENAAGLSSTSFAQGGGMDLSSADVDIINCTIVNNNISNGTNRIGGGFNMANGSVDLINSIVANNSGASAANFGNDIYLGNSSSVLTQTTSLVEDCGNTTGATCPSFSYTDAGNIATIASTCGVQTYYDVTGSNAQNNGTAPSGDIPSTDICGIGVIGTKEIGSFETAILPVELVFFKGKANLKGIQLQWQTASELNNDYFQLERSTNAKHFKAIATIKGAGTTLVKQDYAFLDESPAQGTNYYRLKQVDFDGTVDYSEVLAVEWRQKEKQDFKFFPQPAQEYITIQTEKQGHLKIFDTVGKTVLEQDIMNTQSIDLQHLEPGVYFLHLHEAVQKLIVR